MVKTPTFGQLVAITSLPLRATILFPSAWNLLAANHDRETLQESDRIGPNDLTLHIVAPKGHISTRRSHIRLFLFKHPNSHIDQCLLSTTNLSFTNARLIVQWAWNNLQLLLPLSNVLNPITNCITNIKTLNTPLKKLIHISIHGDFIQESLIIKNNCWEIFQHQGNGKEAR